jgi:peptide/nickel transport system substrate-binding protein
MRIRSRVVTGVVALVVTATGLTACGQGGASSSGRADNTFTYALDEEPITLNPVNQDEHTDPVTEMVFRGLVAHDGENDVVAALAESWEVSSDDLTYTFALRDGVTWHDGAPFSSADVKFTLDAVRAPDSPASTRQNFEAITAVETPDANTVVVQLAEPDAPLLDALTMGILPRHLLAGKDITDPEFSQAPVGTGPFRLVDFQPAQYAELTAFDEYYGGRPKLDKVIITYVPDATARLVQLTNGEVDGSFLEPQQAARVEQEDRLRVRVSPTADYRAVMFNMTKPLFADSRVRQAMNYAVDRDALVEAVLLGYGRPATGPLDLSPVGDPDIASYRFDPATTAELMRQAGYTRTDGGPWSRDGQPMQFSISTFAEDPLRVALLNVVATQLTEAGFDVTAAPKPRDYVVDNWGALDAFVIGWGTPYHPDTSLYGPFHSSQVLAKDGSNFGSYANSAVDAALDAGRTATEEARTAAAYQRFQEAIAADPPYLWLVYLQAINAFPADFEGPTDRTLEHHGYGLFYNAETWHWA